MACPRFTADASLAEGLTQGHHPSKSRKVSIPSSAVIPQGSVCESAFLNSHCPTKIKLGQIACWYLWWNRDVQNACIVAHIPPWCASGCRWW